MRVTSDNRAYLASCLRLELQIHAKCHLDFNPLVDYTTRHTTGLGLKFVGILSQRMRVLKKKRGISFTGMNDLKNICVNKIPLKNLPI